jgi:hypothetical protein
MAGPGFVTIPALDATGAQRSIQFWSSDGTPDGALTAASQPQQFSPTPSTPFPAIIAANSSYSSGVIPAAGLSRVAFGLTLAQAGELTVSRFLDEDGTIKAGADSTLALVATTPAVLDLNDGMLFASFELTITNSAGVGAGLSNTVILLGN